MDKIKKRLVIRPSALQDMRDIFNYIRSDNPGAAKELLKEINEKIMALPDHPKLYRQGRTPNTREMPVRSKYVVIYREVPGIIRILRVLHTARQYP